VVSKLIHSLSNLQKNKPLILCLTNYVTVNFVANILLALRASPLMSEDIREIEELVQISSAVNINIGTLNELFIERAKFACLMAKKHSKPIILDPVGAGASKIRTQIANELLPFVDIVKGNASEIIAISGLSYKTLGVDSVHEVVDAVEVAKALALEKNIIVAVSGEQDFITDGKQERMLSFGSSLMSLVTGMGCGLTAAIAAFRAVIPDSFEATELATAYFGLSGQIAEESSQSTGSFKELFLDNLDQPNWDKIKKLYD
jgi:hydroxyethylthiazole kinase